MKKYERIQVEFHTVSTSELALLLGTEPRYSNAFGKKSDGPQSRCECRREISLLLPTLEPHFRVAHHVPSLYRLMHRTQVHYESYSVLLPVRTVPTADQATYQYCVRLLGSDSKIFIANFLLITWIKSGFLT